MARLIKKTTTHHIDAAGNRVPSGTPGARRVSVESRKWYAAGVPGWPKGKAVPLVADKRLAQKMLADMIARAERGAAGVSEVRDHATPVADLITRFREYVARKSGGKHTDRVVTAVSKVLAECKVRTLGDLRSPDLSAKVEKAVWGRVGELSRLTAAYHGKHVKHFTRWLWRKEKLIDHDPLSGMDLPRQTGGTKRRALSDDELARLLTATRPSTTRFRNLTGEDRYALYAVAVTTGFRAEELSKLTAADLTLDADTPTIRLKGEYTKNGEDAVQPVAPDLMAPLRELAARRPTGPLWPASWWERAADMIRVDLTAAGVPHSTAEGDADFHALRHTFATILGRTATVKVVQSLARHSTPVLTIGRYTHADAAEKARAVATIPLGGGQTELSRTQLEALAATLFALFASLFAPPSHPSGNTEKHLSTKKADPPEAGTGRKPKRS